MKSLLTLTTLLLFLISNAQDTFSIVDYYPIADQNEWRYTAPENWKEGDYISKIEADTSNFFHYFEGTAVSRVPNAKSFKHYDATKAAKLLQLNENGIYYVGEVFSGNESYVLFDTPILWFPMQFHSDFSMDETRGFTRYYNNGNQTKGTFKITQNLASIEDATVSAGSYKDALAFAFETYWDFGKGSEARSINTYHHAKGVGVIKASARFIVMQNKKELINRLIETDMKTYALH